MKKLIIIAVLVCLLSVTATATASKSKYKGDIDPSGRIAFQLEKKKGKQRVLNLKWAALPVDCKGKAETTAGNLSFKVPVKKGAFRAQAVLGSPDRPDARADIRGQISGKSADGRISLSGRKLPLSTGRSGDCRSGKLKWVAAR